MTGTQYLISNTTTAHGRMWNLARRTPTGAEVILGMAFADGAGEAFQTASEFLAAGDITVRWAAPRRIDGSFVYAGIGA